MKEYDSVEVQLRVDAEGDFAQDALVSHHADSPDVHFLIILSLLHHFRRVVQRRP
jgi:hypothetical protein